MHRIITFAAFCCLSLPLGAAEFQNGQAARAVIGQTSFSSHDSGIDATALSISNGRLYVADASNHLLEFDLSHIAAATDDFAEARSTGCAVCGFSPVAVLNQAVTAGIAAVSVYGHSVAIADPPNHRVLVWRDVTSAPALKGPDVVLGTDNPKASPLSAATLVEPVSVALDGKRLFVGDTALHRVLVWNSLPQSDNQPADVVLGQQNFSASNSPDSAAADTIVRPVALQSDGRNLFVADSVSRRILVFTPADVPLSANAITNSATLAPGPLAPGTLITISSAGLADSTSAAPDGGDQPLPHTLAGVELVLDGAALPLLSVSPSEIRAQLLYNVANGSSASLYIRSEHEDGTVDISSAVAVTLSPAAPGLFAFSGKEPRPGMSVHGGADADQAGAPVTSTSPAKPGEAITVWGAGLGLVAASAENGSGIRAGVPNSQSDAPVQLPVTATVSGIPAEVLSAALPQGSIGIYEIRILLPENLPRNSDAILAISQDGRQSNAVTIPIHNSIQ